MTAIRSRPYFWLGAAFVAIVIAAASPLIVAFMAGTAADVLGCSLNEGGATPCLFLGSDIGETLADMFVFGWLSFVTLPWGVLALAIWFVIASTVVAVRWRRRRREA